MNDHSFPFRRAPTDLRYRWTEHWLTLVYVLCLAEQYDDDPYQQRDTSATTNRVARPNALALRHDHWPGLSRESACRSVGDTKRSDPGSSVVGDIAIMRAPPELFAVSLRSAPVDPPIKHPRRRAWPTGARAWRKLSQAESRLPATARSAKAA